MLIAGVYVCTFQPGNFVGCDNKGLILFVYLGFRCSQILYTFDYMFCILRFRFTLRLGACEISFYIKLQL